MTPMKAIRAKCLDCCCGSSNEVRLCTANAPFSSQNPHSTPNLEEEPFGEYKDTTPDTNSAEPPVRTIVFEETEE